MTKKRKSGGHSGGGRGRSGLVQCSNCVLPGTIIGGDFKPIEDYKVNDECVSTRVGKVTKTFVHEHDGTIIRVKARNMLPLELTPEHPVLTVPRKYVAVHAMHRVRGHLKPMYTDIRVFGNPQWKPASELVPINGDEPCDHVVVPLPKNKSLSNTLSLKQFTTSHGFRITQYRKYPTTFKVTEKTAWLMGLYVAKGCTGTSQVIFTVGTHEKRLIKKCARLVRQIGYSPTIRVDSTTRTETRIEMPSRLLCRAFKKWFGHKAHAKRIPDFVLYNNRRILRSFLSGYLAGDGYNRVKRARWEGNTASKVLALQLQLLGLRLGYGFWIREDRRDKPSFIGGRKLNQRKTRYCYGFMKDYTRTRMDFFEQYVLTPVVKKKQIRYKGTVHNLETTTENYLSNNILVHNCGRPVPRDKAKRDTRWTSLVDPSLARELRAQGAQIARERVTKLYCISCAIHFGLVKVRSADERRY